MMARLLRMSVPWWRAQVVYISGILTRTHYGASRLFQRLFYEEGQNGDLASKLISQSI